MVQKIKKQNKQTVNAEIRPTVDVHRKNNEN